MSQTNVKAWNRDTDKKDSFVIAYEKFASKYKEDKRFIEWVRAFFAKFDDYPPEMVEKCILASIPSLRNSLLEHKKRKTVQVFYHFGVNPKAIEFYYTLAHIEPYPELVEVRKRKKALEAQLKIPENVIIEGLMYEARLNGIIEEEETSRDRARSLEAEQRLILSEETVTFFSKGWIASLPPFF